MEEPEYGTIDYFKVPGKWDEFVRRTGFVDTIDRERARAKGGTTPLNGISDTHIPEPAPHSGS